MIRAFIESFMGPLFVALLHWWEANGLLLNSIVVLYGFTILLSWLTLLNIRKRLIAAIIQQVIEAPSLSHKSKPTKVLAEVTIPWQEVTDLIKFPFVAERAGLIPKRRTVETIQALLDEQDLATAALEALAEHESSKS